jgi:hypothetical protein
MRTGNHTSGKGKIETQLSNMKIKNGKCKMTGRTTMKILMNRNNET